MTQVEARKSKTEEKVPKIEEKEDNHIANLDAQLETMFFLDIVD